MATLLRLSSCTRLCTRPLNRAATRSFKLSAVPMAAAAPTYHILHYKYVPDILDKRGPFRAEHIDGAKKKAAEGKIVLAGALQDPVDSALFVFKDTSVEEIEEFVKADPYVINGLVPEWSVRPYGVVVP